MFTLSHLSTHLLWNSWLHGRTLTTYCENDAHNYDHDDTMVIIKLMTLTIIKFYLALLKVAHADDADCLLAILSTCLACVPDDDHDDGDDDVDDDDDDYDVLDQDDDDDEGLLKKYQK